MMSDKFKQVVTADYLRPNFTADENSNILAVNRLDATMDAIKAYILRHQLTTGDPLPTEAKLCADLGVSRSSVREALRKLEALDIISVRQGRGSVVGQMSMQPLVETLVLKNALDHTQGTRSLRSIVATRRFLDLGVAEEIVTNMKGTSNPHLSELVSEMTRKAQNNELFPNEDIAFHTALLRSLNNDLIEQLMQAMWLVHQAIIPQLMGKDTRGLIHTAESHQRMLDAAEKGDLQAYIEAINEHYQPLDQIIKDNENKPLS
ncbi:FadR/GntR family transcriptional regulator [Arcanobacterium bovis]|nr:GntR family transcriptional regulator [Arcanobacterium bovis]